ncbi:MAG: hypothetical protein LBB98_11840 [Treponema sp.]|jgi:hypothetical protein|nr:hypothetical protein [Treponema sp.]
MEYLQEAGVFIRLKELMTIFPRIKQGEQTMNGEELQVLMKMEKALYEYLSVEEAENLMHIPGSLGKGDGR